MFVTNYFAYLYYLLFFYLSSRLFPFVCPPFSFSFFPSLFLPLLVFSQYAPLRVPTTIPK
jgi:hypothetical protein